MCRTVLRYTVLLSLLVACSGAKVPPPMPPAEPEPAQPPVAVAPVVGPAQPVPAPPSDKGSPRLAKTAYGGIEGKNVELYTLTNSSGMVLKVATYGAMVTELHVPDRAGRLDDIVLGFDTLAGYTGSTNQFFGATVGRIANRIRDGKFKLAGKDYKLAVNNPPHHLHGGNKGFDKVLWSADAKDTPDGPSVVFTYVSPDGDEGYPGKLTARTVYTLTDRGELRIDMDAVTDKTTIVNLANHSYFNLSGHAAGSIAQHQLELSADQYTPGDPLVPSGVVKPVKSTAFDFTTPKPIGRDLGATGLDPAGFDHNFVVRGVADALRPVARVKDPKSGRVMTLEANQPGVQFYTGNYLNGQTGKGGATYSRHGAFCLETQKFPNAIGVPAWQKQVVLEPGQTYRHTMVLRFTTE
jgi:aldose 1-epimerase